MSEFGQVAGSSFGSFFTRTFSFITFIVGMVFALYPEHYPGSGDIPYDILVPVLIILGAHGTLTKYSDVGIFRKFLCFMAGVPGAVVVFNVIGQLLNL